MARNVNATYTEEKQDRSFNVSVIGVAAAHVTDRIGALKAFTGGRRLPKRAR